MRDTTHTYICQSEVVGTKTLDIACVCVRTCVWLRDDTQIYMHIFAASGILTTYPKHLKIPTTNTPSSPPPACSLTPTCDPPRAVSCLPNFSFNGRGQLTLQFERGGRGEALGSDNVDRCCMVEASEFLKDSMWKTNVDKCAFVCVTGE